MNHCDAARTTCTVQCYPSTHPPTHHPRRTRSNPTTTAAAAANANSSTAAYLHVALPLVQYAAQQLLHGLLGVELRLITQLERTRQLQPTGGRYTSIQQPTCVSRGGVGGGGAGRDASTGSWLMVSPDREHWPNWVARVCSDLIGHTMSKALPLCQHHSWWHSSV